MSKKRRDVLEQTIEAALAPGCFIGYRASTDFVNDLELVLNEIRPLIKRNGGAARAIELLDTFIAGCLEKTQELDDSFGSFGPFIEDLFSDWIRARQAAKEDPAETACVILSWMENDTSGYCYCLEKPATKVLNRAGLAAFERAVQDMPEDGPNRAIAHRRKVEILATIYEKRRDVEAYSALREAEGVLTPRDCETLAKMSLKRRRPEEALEWVERGRALEKKGRTPNRSAWDLPGLERQILKKLGRADDARTSAWKDYQSDPSIYSYSELMKLVPEGKRAEWHQNALAVLDDTDLASRIEVLVQTKERERLATTIETASPAELRKLSHYTTEPAAKCLERKQPLLAAKLYVAMGLRIVVAKKSKYYGAAVANLAKARQLLLKKGRDEEWQTLEAEIRETHRAKRSFISRFEQIAEGRSAKASSFRDRAKKRWNQGSGAEEAES